MKYDLFISDFDGTLGRAPFNQIDEKTVSAIKEYTKKGGIFALVTGRQFSSIAPICRRYGIKGIIACYQGAMIKDIESGKDILINGIDVDLTLDIVEKFRSEDVQIIVDIDDKMYYDVKTKYVEFFENSTHVKANCVQSLAQTVKKIGKKAQKVCLMCNEKRAKELAEKYNKIYGGKILFNNGAPFLIDAVNPECCKDFAVRFLSNYYNIPFDKIITVGDSDNDIGLIKGEWYGVAVGDGSDKLKKVAKEVTLPFDKNPVLELLKKYCL